MFIPNHLHLIVKGYFNTNIESIDSLNEWLIKLVHRVNMVPVLGPNSIYVNDEGNKGITGTVVLSTSHASIHVWDETFPYLFQFDLYSCSEFKINDVLEMLNEFNLKNYEYLFIDRNNEFKILDFKMNI